MSRISELILGLLVVAACILVMAVTGAADAEAERSLHRLLCQHRTARRVLTPASRWDTIVSR
jgi:hypothetical protein